MTKQQIGILTFFISVLALFLPWTFGTPLLMFLFFFISTNKKWTLGCVLLGNILLSLLQGQSVLPLVLSTVVMGGILLWLMHWTSKMTPLTKGLSYMASAMIVTSVIPTIIGLWQQTLMLNQSVFYMASLIKAELPCLLILSFVLLLKRK